MRRPIAALLAGLAAALAPVTALMAQEPAGATAADEEPMGEIIVDGYTEKEVRHFLWRSVIETGGTIAKRSEPICIGIDNAPAELAEPVRARIGANLAAFGIAVAEPGCRANAVVVFHRDAHKFVNWLDKRHGQAFQALYKPEKRRLIRPERAFYSWHYIKTEADRMQFGGQPLQLPGPGEVAFQPIAFSPGGPLTLWSAPAATSHSFTVIDTDALEGISTQQLGDFLTMQMLVEFRPGSRPEIPQDSILNLFTDTGGNPEAAAEMSKLDRAVLSEFYSDRQNWRLGAVRSAIASRAIGTLDEEGYILAGK